jgi:DNA-binding XRE family transcriptional regulator
MDTYEFGLACTLTAKGFPTRMAQRINQKLVNAFGRALTAIRKEKGLTQEQVAFGAGVHRTYIAFLEGGRKQPSIDAVFKIASGLGLKPSELIARVEIYYRRK